MINNFDDETLTPPLISEDFVELTASTTRVMELMGDHAQAVTAMAYNMGLDDIQQQTNPSQWFVAFACWQQACQFADNYTNNDFADVASQGIFEVEIPVTVQAGVVQYACYLYQKRIMGVKNESAGDVSQTWDIETLKNDAVMAFGRYRKQPGF